MAAGTEEDPSVRHWLEFHEQNERFDPGYRTSFSIDELDAAVRCHDDHGFVSRSLQQSFSHSQLNYG
jgi:hypothetical protein